MKSRRAAFGDGRLGGGRLGGGGGGGGGGFNVPLMMGMDVAVVAGTATAAGTLKGIFVRGTRAVGGGGTAGERRNADTWSASEQGSSFTAGMPLPFLTGDGE